MSIETIAEILTIFGNVSIIILNLFLVKTLFSIAKDFMASMVVEKERPKKTVHVAVPVNVPVVEEAQFPESKQSIPESIDELCKKKAGRKPRIINSVFEILEAYGGPMCQMSIKDVTRKRYELGYVKNKDKPFNDEYKNVATMITLEIQRYALAGKEVFPRLHRDRPGVIRIKK